MVLRAAALKIGSLGLGYIVLGTAALKGGSRTATMGVPLGVGLCPAPELPNGERWEDVHRRDDAGLAGGGGGGGGQHPGEEHDPQPGKEQGVGGPAGAPHGQGEAEREQGG